MNGRGAIRLFMDGIQGRLDNMHMSRRRMVVLFMARIEGRLNDVIIPCRK